MTRVPGVDTDHAAAAEKAVFDRQTERWGAPLEPYKVYSRRPTILHAVVGMWNALSSSGLLDGRLTTLINRRVAALNGCLF